MNIIMVMDDVNNDKRNQKHCCMIVSGVYFCHY